MPPTFPARTRPLAVTAVALLLSAAAGPVARADDAVGPDVPPPTAVSSGQCPVGHFCLWSGTGFSGLFWSTSGAGLRDVGMVAGSLWNRQTVDVRTFTGSGGTGTPTCWNAGAQATSIALGVGSVRTMTATTC
ncbi:peptidase inhibitor family I36 protein [Cellulomonas sp. NPDC058312]|uniref:peptidase inhibitor family I36 protein n=1 Tax=Cellulomonas sp. NPDC058312 TaxID=3346441 RepID=UPI0036E9EA5C